MEQVRTHLAFALHVELTRFAEPVVQVRPTLHFSSLTGEDLDPKGNVRRAKAVRKVWYNDKWLARIAAIGEYLADGQESWPLSGTIPTTVESKPFALTAPLSLDESSRSAALGRLGHGHSDLDEAVEDDLIVDVDEIEDDDAQ